MLVDVEYKREKEKPRGESGRQSKGEECLAGAGGFE